ncbi:MAG: hypothetical protein JRG84_20865 [Deltaproteobacteria bacterium]|nr:hypothetical protein [Deltaproteobacteria bacterium]
MRNYVLSLLVALATSGCNGPFGLLPGGALEGEARPLPPEWSFAGDYGTAQLQTKPEEPYSVNLAYTTRVAPRPNGCRTLRRIPWCACGLTGGSMTSVPNA